MNKYEQELLQSCSRLDAVANCNGNVSSCAKEIICGNKEAIKKLYKYIEKAAELKDVHITTIAIAAKDSLMKYFGYQYLSNL